MSLYVPKHGVSNIIIQNIVSFDYVVDILTLFEVELFHLICPCMPIYVSIRTYVPKQLCKQYNTYATM